MAFSTRRAAGSCDLDPAEPHLAQDLDLGLVREAVVERLPVAPSGHQPVRLELREVLRHRRLGDVEDLTEVAHADFANLVEEEEESEASRLRHHVQDGGPLIQVGRELHRFFPALDNIAVGFGGVALDGHRSLSWISVAADVGPYRGTALVTPDK